MEPDWDLHAVVRGFAALNKNTQATVDLDHSGSSSSVASSNIVGKQVEDWWHRGLCSTNLSGADEFQELCTPSYFLDQRQTQSVQPTISAYLAALQAYKKRTEHRGNDAPAPITQKPKKRKKHQKTICHVPAEALYSDVWSWRKYGQKPIKGSPYPRSYYKCSSSKACLARKLVERNRSDPNMFIVTYTAEHNHPAPTHKNCLAGTTRNPHSLATASAAVHDESNLPTSKPSSSSSMATTSPEGSIDDEVLQQSKVMENMSVDAEKDMNTTNMQGDVMEFLNMDSTNDFYGDLEEISSSPITWFSPDQFLPSFPWMANNGSIGDMY